MLKRTIALLLAVFVVLLGGCSNKKGNTSSDTENGSDGADISVFSYKADTYCPIASNNQANIRMLGIVYEGLISLNDTLMPEGCLAESWNVSGDGLNWTLKLRKNVLWHSGGEFTSDDVVYTVNQIKAMDTSAYRYNVSNIAGIKASGENEVKITLTKPIANFVNLLYFPIIKKADDEINLTSYKPDGTGPYMFEDRNEGNVYYLVANKKWWGGHIVAQTVKVRMLPGGDTALYAFSSGSIDLAPVENMDWGQFVDPTSAAYTSVATPVYDFLGINHRNRILSLPEIREAISLAIDRDEIVEKVMLGYAQPANAPVRKEWFVRGSQDFEHKQNTDAAKRLLEENLWRFENNTYRKSIENVMHSAQFNILINEENTVRENIARVISDNLETFGIKATVTRVPYDTYKEKIQNGDYDAFIGSIALSPDLDFLNIFGEGNMFGFQDDEMQQVMSEMQNKQSAEDIKTAYAEFINLFEQINPVVGLFFENTVMIYSKRIEEEGIKPSYFDMYRGIENMRKGEA
ncbi:MAG: ABC transporter substrate-binding protein [Clostridia bacterium]|nr:ABC transporter substrate-binding protein [Clostridia bacterium]